MSKSWVVDGKNVRLSPARRSPGARRPTTSSCAGVATRRSSRETMVGTGIAKLSSSAPTTMTIAHPTTPVVARPRTRATTSAPVASAARRGTVDTASVSRSTPAALAASSQSNTDGSRKRLPTTRTPTAVRKSPADRGPTFVEKSLHTECGAECGADAPQHLCPGHESALRAGEITEQPRRPGHPDTRSAPPRRRSP